MTAWIDSAELSRIVGTTFLHFLWQGTLVAAIVAVTFELLRHASASARYTVAVLGLFVIAAAPVVTALSLGILETPVAAPAIASAAGQVIGDARETPWIFAALAAFWGIGATLFWLRFVAQWLYTIRLRMAALSEAPALAEAIVREFVDRSGLRRSVRVFESGLACVPVVVGWLRPVILLPASAVRALSPDELRAVMLHELAHIRRHDGLINLVQAFVESTLFFHPAVWWISHRIRTEREYCCDDLVAGRRAEAVTYARALFLLDSLSSREAEPMTVGSTGGPLMQRISRITGQDMPVRRRAIAWMAPLLVAAAAVTTFAAFRPATACPPEKDKAAAELAEAVERARLEEHLARAVRVDPPSRSDRDAERREAEIAELEAMREQMRRQLAELEARLEAIRSGRNSKRSDDLTAARRNLEAARAEQARVRQVIEQSQQLAREQQDRARDLLDRNQQLAREQQAHGWELLERSRRAAQEQALAGQARYDEQRARYDEIHSRYAEQQAHDEEARAQCAEDHVRSKEYQARQREAERRQAEELLRRQQRFDEMSQQRRMSEEIRDRELAKAEANRADAVARRLEAEYRARVAAETARARMDDLAAEHEALRSKMRSLESGQFTWDEAQAHASRLGAEAERLRDLAAVERQRAAEAVAGAVDRRDAQARMDEVRRRLDELAVHGATSEAKAADAVAALENARAKLERLAAEDVADDAAKQRAMARMQQRAAEAAKQRSEAVSASNTYRAMLQQYEEGLAQQRAKRHDERSSCEARQATDAERASVEQAVEKARAASMAVRAQALARQAQVDAIRESIRRADPGAKRDDVTVRQVLEGAAKRLQDQELQVDETVRRQLLERLEETRRRLDQSRQVEEQKAAEIEALRNRIERDGDDAELKEREKKEAKAKRRELHVLANPDPAKSAPVTSDVAVESRAAEALPIGLDAYLHQLRLDKTAKPETPSGGLSF